MWEYVCDKVIPGCTHTERGDTSEAVREKARAHLEGHHDLNYIDDDQWRKIDLAILQVRTQ